MTQTTDLIPFAFEDGDDSQEVGFTPFQCPRCKLNITDPTVHGWLINRVPHDEHAGHKQHNTGLSFKDGRFCEVPCPECTDPARARAKADQTARLMGESMIPQYMQGWSFTTAPDDIDKQALDKCSDFAHGNLPQRGLFLHGTLGIGKSGMAISIIQAAIWRGESAAYIRSIDLMNRLREAVAKSMRHEPSDGDALLDMAKTVQWLALDDLATERPTAFVLEQLYALVEARRSAGLYTVFTCNFNLSQLEEQWRPADVAKGGFHAGRRVVERIGEYCAGVSPKNGNLRRRNGGQR
jgi:DNA replication protein DnaC